MPAGVEAANGLGRFCHAGSFGTGRGGAVLVTGRSGQRLEYATQLSGVEQFVLGLTRPQPRALREP